MDARDKRGHDELNISAVSFNSGRRPAPFLAAVRGHHTDIMATKPVPPRPAPRLYLATPLVADPTLLASQLPALLAAADIAAVLLRLAPSDERGIIQRTKALAPVVQNAGAALLLGGKRRRGQQCAEVRAFDAHLLQRPEIGLDGRQFLFVVREIEQGLSIPAAHIRSLGIVRHLICPPVRVESREKGVPHRGLKA